MVFCVFDKVPYNEKIIHISHILYGAKFISQPVFQLLRRFTIALTQSFVAELLQIFPRSKSIRHIIFRQLCHSELDLHQAAVCNLLSIIQRLKGIWEKLLHLLRGFHIILPALIAHSVLIRKLFPRLDAQQNIMRLFILSESIMNIVGRHQFNPCLLRHFEKLLVHQRLFWDTVVLKLKEKIVRSKNPPVFQSYFFRLVIKFFRNIPLHFSGQTRA